MGSLQFCQYTVVNAPVIIDPSLESVHEQWGKSPVYVEENSLNTNSVISLLGEKGNIPISDLAQLEKPLCRTAIKINSDFQVALDEYKKSLQDASTADAILKNCWSSRSADYMAIGLIITKFISYAPEIYIIKQVATPILAIIGTFFGLIKKNQIIAEMKDQNISRYRRAWIRDVELKEQSRIQKAMGLIQLRLEVLYPNKPISTGIDHLLEDPEIQHHLEDMNLDLLNTDLYDISDNHEVEQLKKLNDYLSTQIMK